MSFRPSLRLLALQSGITSIPLNATSEIAKELLPPLALYRRLLRVHRKVLPIELRVMGDDYVKAEFRRTRSTDNPLHIVGFLSEWKKYLDFHESQLPSTSFSSSSSSAADSKSLPGQTLDPSILESLSAEQIGQLYELFQATKEVYMTEEERKRMLEEKGQTQEGIPTGEVVPDLGKGRGERGPQ
ncbi:Sdh7p [Sporobolomyces salmoneus]|uniref:Sdh7p n=1 Tax=Sporobolomyces salmoneus TaxID=183962 RepID=UPI00316CD020